jgi:hypothetical protein
MPHRPSRLKNRGDRQAYFADLHATPRPPNLSPDLRRPMFVPQFGEIDFDALSA